MDADVATLDGEFWTENLTLAHTQGCLQIYGSMIGPVSENVCAHCYTHT